MEFVNRIHTGCDNALDEVARRDAFADVDNGMTCARQVKVRAQDGRFARRCQAVDVEKGRRREMRLCLINTARARGEWCFRTLYRAARCWICWWRH